MATNTTATATTHTGNGSTNNFAISFSFLANNEVDVTVAGVLKTLDTHYTISGSTVTFTSGNTPANGAAIKFQRDTNISAKKVDFQDGSVLTETDLDNNSDQILFAQQEIINDFVKRDGSNSVTGNLVFEGSTDDANETTLAITNPTADRTITIPDITGTVVTTGDTGTVSNQMIAGDAVTNAKIADDSIDSEHYVDLSIDTQHIANENITTAKLAPDAITSAKLADNSVNSEHYVDGSIDHVHLANDIIDGDNIQDDVINSEHYVAGSIDHEHLANDIIDGDNIQDDVINSEHYVAGSIDHEHLANDIIDGDNVQDNAINNEHIAANAVRVNEIKDGEITSAKLNPSAVITASEQASATTNDTSFLTSAAADARFFNISTGDTIKDGDTFPDNDTTIATTAAINDRIIDLIDDVGGFVPIANETSFPTANPDVNNGTGTIVSVAAASTNLTPSGTTVTIANGAGSGNTVTITGVPSVISSGFGFLVETTTTLHTYTFHRLVPKATEVTAVAGKATEIGRLGTADAVADMAILGTADVVADMAILGTNDVVADMNTLATADIVSDMNTLAVADVISDMDTVATNVTNVNNVGGSISNVNTTAGSIANVNTVAGSITNVNNVGGSITNVNNVGNSISNVNTVASNLTNVNAFANQYRIGSSNPTTSLDTGDLFFNTSTNSLKVYTGSAWVDGVTQTGNFALKTGNTFTGNNIYNDNVKVIYGTSSDGLEIFHNASDSIINDQGTGSLKLQTGGNTKIEITSTGTSVTGNIVVSGNVDGRDIAADGTKLDGIESGATADQSASEIVGLIADQTIAPSTIDMEDNEKIKLGAGDDLELFHSGSQSEINSITGGLVIKDTGGFMRIRSDELKIQSTANENYIECDANGAVQLFHNNAVKFVTSSSGGTITGTLVADGFTGPLTGNVTGNATSADTIDVTNTPTDSSFALTFVATSGSAKSLLCDTSGILFNPYSNTLTTGTFNGSGSSLTNLNADNISSGTLASARIADDAVTTAKIADANVTTAKIADDAVTAAKIVANAVGASEIANDSVGTNALTNNAVQTANIADDAVTFAKMQNTANGVRFLGKHDSGGGEIGEITAAQARTMLNVEDGATAGGGGLVKLATRRYYGFEQTTGIGNAGFTKMTKAFVTITPSSASNYIRLGGVMNWSGSDTENQYSFRWRREISGGATTSLDSELGEGTRPAIQFRLLGNGDVATLQLQGVIDYPNTTSAVTYYIEVFVDGANQSVYLNRGQNDSNDPRYERAASYFTAEEIDNSIHTHTNTNS